MRLAIGLTLGLLSQVNGWGQTCSNVTVSGTYAFTCSGFASPAAGAPQAPFSALGMVKLEYSGAAAGTAKASIGGIIVDQTVTGTAITNNDCTGNVSYDQKINGQPAPKLNIVYHVLDDGKEIRGMSVDTGATMLCNLRLIGR